MIYIFCNRKTVASTLCFWLLMMGILLFIDSCNQVNNQKNQPSESTKISKPQIIKKPGSSFNDTLIIKSNSAVFYSPDSVQMEKIKKVNDKKIFDLLTHNCHYQMQNAREVIRKYWPHLKRVETCKVRYLLFQKINKKTKCIDLNDKNDICGLLLFDGKKDPVLVDMPNIDTQLRIYFSR